MQINKSIGYLAAVAGFTSMLALGAQAQDEANAQTIASKFDIAYLSKYVWRGLVLNPEPVAQPSLTFTLPSGLSYNLWMSMDTEDSTAGPSGRVVEHDHTLNYPLSIGSYSANVGYIYYAFPSTVFKSTQEIYASVCLGGRLSPTLGVNYDFDEVRGAYFSLGIGYCCGIPFSKAELPCTLSAKVGHGSSSYAKRTYGGPDKSALLDLTFGVSTALPLSKTVSLVPSVTYSTMMDSAVADALADPDNLTVGATLSTSF